MDLLPQSLLSPAAEVVVDGLPGRQVMGQQRPGAAGPHPVGHGVDQLPAVMDGWAVGGNEVRRWADEAVVQDGLVAEVMDWTELESCWLRSVVMGKSVG